jgi:NAD-dependent SIR2 family protein deacetylase
VSLPAVDVVSRPVDVVIAELAGTGFVALTGAGISTDSGIPDYRGPQSIPRTPMTYQEFVSGPRAQQRYWARAHLGWTRMGGAQPNGGHLALAQLQQLGVCTGLITQNVDGLHEEAGSDVIALHGRIADVVCLSCRAVIPHRTVQRRMAELNPDWLERHAHAPVRPDGDVELDETGAFAVPRCDCGGRLKPDVVFFGENVPKARVARCFALVDEAPTLLVLGSSLAVMSGLRFVRYAAKRGITVVIVNRGVTRGDALATTTLHHGTTEFLTSLVSAVS